MPGSGYRKLVGRGGTWRVAYAVDDEVVTVWEVWVDGVRSAGAAYAEALHRMQSADTPEGSSTPSCSSGWAGSPAPCRCHPPACASRSPTGSPTRWSARAASIGWRSAALDAATAFDRWNRG